MIELIRRRSAVTAPRPAPVGTPLPTPGGTPPPATAQAASFRPSERPTATPRSTVTVHHIYFDTSTRIIVDVNRCRGRSGSRDSGEPASIPPLEPPFCSGANHAAVFRFERSNFHFRSGLRTVMWTPLRVKSTGDSTPSVGFGRTDKKLIHPRPLTEPLSGRTDTNPSSRMSGTNALTPSRTRPCAGRGGQ